MGSISNFSREIISKKRKRDESLVELLSLLTSAALDPCDERFGSDRQWKSRVLKARKARFLKLDDVSDLESEEFPYWKKLKRDRKFLTPRSSSQEHNNPTRRSRRTLLKLGNGELTRKRIPIGPDFQAEVPGWTGLPRMELNDSKLLGTKLWPIEDKESQISNELYDKPKSYSCDCTYPGSEKCVKYHVSAARRRLKSDLGTAFYDMGFSEMGEEVSKSWTQKEQMKFDQFVKENPVSEGKSFMEPALEYFSSKSMRDIVSFYFNVYMLRWMGVKTRHDSHTVYSSDDECLESDK